MKVADKLTALRAKSVTVNKAYGGDQIVRSGTITNIPRIPTGSLAMDYVCGVNEDGVGGWAVGHGNCLVGWESSGKTTSALKACANLQRMCVRCYRPCADFGVERMTDESGKLVLADVGGFTEDGSPRQAPYYTIKGRCSCYKEGLWAPKAPELKGSVADKKAAQAEWVSYLAQLSQNSFEPATIVYADVENTLDLKWGKKNGLVAFVYDEEYKANCPVASFQHVVPHFAEQAIDIVDEYILSGVVDLVVVDSIPAMVPKEERDASAEDWQRGLQARLINKAFRRWVSSQAAVSSRAEARRLVTTLYVQQWRNTMSAFSGNTMPGGNGQRFAYSLINEVYTSEKEKRADATAHVGGTNSEGGATGKETVESTYVLRVNVKNRKNKTWPPGKEASFRMAVMDDDGVKAGDVLDQDYILKSALQLGVIVKDGAKYKFRGKEYTSQSSVSAELAANPQAKAWALMKIRKAFYAAAESV
jgi:RecA/RadA recombinase